MRHEEKQMHKLSGREYCSKCDVFFNINEFHSCHSEYENLKRMAKAYTLKQASKEGVANYDINNVVCIDKDVLNHIIRDEMMNDLLLVLGVNGFNRWYVETIGGKAPFRYIGTKNSKPSHYRRYRSQRYHIIEDDEKYETTKLLKGV